MANNILSYTSRDFKSIKQDLINAIPTLTDIWTNREESDPGMVLLTLMSALGDNLSYNMDKQSLEFFGQTVTQRKNASRLFDLVSYKMHWYKSAKLELTIYNGNSSQVSLLFNQASINSQRIVSSNVTGAPAYFLLYPEETPSNWNSNKIISIPSGSSATFKAIQGELNSITFPSTAIDVNNRYYLPVSKLDQDHIWLSDDKNYQWYLVNNIHELTETVPRFEFGVDEYNLPYIEFVPYWRTSFGETHNFILYYLSTRGSSGGVTANILNLIPSLKRINSNADNSFNDNISITHESNVFDSSNVNNAPGKDPQTAAEAYIDSRHYIGTYNTLVTLIDFENFINRLDIISNSKAIDGQYANELNEKLLNFLKNKYRNTENADDVILKLYDANLIRFNQYENNKDLDGDGDVDDDDLELANFGFKPYTLQLHLIAGNFLLRDILNDSILATETNKIVDSDANDGYIEYMLSDNIIGTSDDSTISQSGINDYKLFTADLSYAPIRKFPFFINGQIHLKEPMRPVEANLVLYNVYTALVRRFNASNLTIGEKINFKDILDTINSADENIYYFDAGANSATGSLIEYPISSDFNYETFNYETMSYSEFGVTINPNYFNDVSMQAYADIIQNNNVLMYFCNTFSNKLTIADDSISSKDNPPIYNTQLQASIELPSQDSDVLDVDLSVYSLQTDGSTGDLIIDGGKIFRYAAVKTVSIDCRGETPTWEVITTTNPIGLDYTTYYDMSEIESNNLSDGKLKNDGTPDISTWLSNNEFNMYKTKRTVRYRLTSDDHTKSNLYNGTVQGTDSSAKLEGISFENSGLLIINLKDVLIDDFDNISKNIKAKLCSNDDTVLAESYLPVDIKTDECTIVLNAEVLNADNPTTNAYIMIDFGASIQFSATAEVDLIEGWREDHNNIMFATAMTETISTNESDIIYCTKLLTDEI